MTLETAEVSWGIKVKDRNSYVWRLWPNTYWYRSDAIKAYNLVWGKSNAYRKDRRAGKVMAVRIRLVEMRK